MDTPDSRAWPPCVEVIDDRTTEMLRAMTPQARLAAANLMSIQAREMTLHSIRVGEPQWSEERVRAEYSRRIGIWAHETSWRKRRDDLRAETFGIS